MSETLSTALVAAMRNPVGLMRDGLLYTPVFRVAFPHLDAPWAGQEGAANTGKPAFSLLAVFHDDANLAELMTDLNKKLIGKFGPKAPTMVQHGAYRYALRPKAIMAERFAGFDGTGFFASLRAQESAPPMCIAYIDGKPTTLQQGAIERHLYAGSYAYATVNTFAYDNIGKGVSLSLRTVVKVGDGERFGGPKATTQEEAMAAISGVSLPAGLVPASAPMLEGRAEPAPFDPAAAALATVGAATALASARAKAKPAKQGYDELMEIFNS